MEVAVKTDTEYLEAFTITRISSLLARILEPALAGGLSEQEADWLVDSIAESIGTLTHAPKPST